MAGIYPITMLNYNYGLAYGEQKLTAATKAKLQALGVDTAGIRTESEGQYKLRLAEAERLAGGTKAATKKAEKETDDENLQLARDLAKKLNVSYYSDENVTEICSRIQSKLYQMRVDAKDDFDKNSNVDYYQRQLDDIEAYDTSAKQLASSMDLTANMNVAFHNLF